MPTEELAVEIEHLGLVGEPTAGSTVELELRYHAHVSGNGEVTLRFPGSITPVGYQGSERVLRQPVQLVAGQTRTVRRTMRVEGVGGSLVSVSVAALDVSPEVHPSASRYLSVESEASEARVYTWDAPGTEEKRTTLDQEHVVDESSGRTTYTISLSGKILTPTPDPEFGVRGLYNATVRLYFRDSSDPFSYSYLYKPAGPDVRHKTYDDLDDEGRFSFNFTLNGDLSAFDQIVVVPSSFSYAADMVPPPGGLALYNINGTLVRATFSLAESATFPIDASSTTVSGYDDATVNMNYGAILRYMALARDFAITRYGGTPPFSLPPVRVNLEPGLSAPGRFLLYNPLPTALIQINPDNGVTFDTIAHEYGHYASYNMWGRDAVRYGLRESYVREGWAIFYSFATRNYANDQYGDDLNVFDSNLERGPFDSPRFLGISYRTTEPENSATACLLWNLYDGYNGGAFESFRYDSGDNDDVSGYQLRLFETVRTTGASIFDTVGALDLMNEFNNGLDADVQNSVGQVYNSMLCPGFPIIECDFGDPPPAPLKMLAPQVKNLRGSSSSGSITLRWEPQTYASSPFYANGPAGYRIYRGSTPVATVSPQTTSHTFNGADGTYSITAFNEAGESANPPSRNVRRLNVRINGPDIVQGGQTYVWTAGVSGGRPPYSYEWEYFYTCNTPPPGCGGTRPVCFSKGTGSDANLAVEQDGGGVPFGPSAPTCNAWVQASTTSSLSNFTVNDHSSVTGLRLRLSARDSDGTRKSTTNQLFYSHSRPSESEVEVEAGAGASPPEAYALSGVTPNPSRGEAVVSFALPEAAEVRLTLYDLLGRAVTDLAKGPYEAGHHAARLDGRGLPAGVYVVRLTATGAAERFAETSRVTLLR
ncbi:MAG: T9SS type A sorting domain-containing protein [Bacteroidota bacterium]